MSQILMVLSGDDGTPLFRRANHARLGTPPTLTIPDEVTIFGENGKLLRLEVSCAWTLLTNAITVELVELVPHEEISRNTLEAAGFDNAAGSALLQDECIVIENLIRGLRVQDEDAIVGAAREIV